MSVFASIADDGSKKFFIFN